MGSGARFRGSFPIRRIWRESETCARQCEAKRPSCPAKYRCAYIAVRHCNSKLRSNAGLPDDRRRRRNAAPRRPIRCRTARVSRRRCLRRVLPSCKIQLANPPQRGHGDRGTAPDVTCRFLLRQRRFLLPAVFEFCGAPTIRRLAPGGSESCFFAIASENGRDCRCRSRSACPTADSASS